jgi:excisionase family DNA binding protein
MAVLYVATIPTSFPPARRAGRRGGERSRAGPAAPDPEVQPLMTAAEVAPFLALSPRRVYERAAEGALPSIRFGGRVLFQTAALRRWLGIDPPAPNGGAGGGETAEGAADALAP